MCITYLYHHEYDFSMFFNQYIFRLKSHPTQEYGFLTLNCKMSIKAGASRSDIDIITWKRSSCIHQKPCNKTMLFYLKSSVYEKKNLLKKPPERLKSTYILKTSDSYIAWFHSTCTIWCCSREFSFLSFFFSPSQIDSLITWYISNT